jgi:hypothetical protein
MFYLRQQPKSFVDANLKGFTNRQSLVAKFSIFLFAFTLTILTGYLSGALSGGYFTPTLFYSEEQIKGTWLGICITLAVLVWSFEIKQTSIGRGFF